ncbi:lysine/arginine/ornithine ABC transporter substrate-binding protein [Thorsellia kenyensis]|uniref:Lysine/arginine/ornithine ABC transporter substrate-binding protein n=1 Tax=Thorsellia kenyensis TaxID=1549888 RepID=A0ABV6CEQ5_9GAMM
MVKALVMTTGCLALTISSFTQAAIPDSLRVSTNPAYAPFSYKTSDNQVAGFDIDLGNEICKRLAVECTWTEAEFDALIPGLLAKKSDFIVSSVSITPERLKQIDFSDKLYSANSRLIAPEGEAIEPTVESLKGKSVGVLQGSVQEAYANDKWRVNGVDVIAYQNQDLVYADLVAGRLDTAFQDEAAASFGFLQDEQGKGFVFAGPAVKDDIYFGPGTGAAIRKEDKELTQAINKVLSEMLADGTYEEIAKKYFDFDIYGH